MSSPIQRLMAMNTDIERGENKKSYIMTTLVIFTLLLR